MESSLLTNLLCNRWRSTSISGESMVNYLGRNHFWTTCCRYRRKHNGQCVIWFHETKSSICVQREFRHCYGRNPPDVQPKKRWYGKVIETGSVFYLPRSGSPRVREATVENVRQSYRRSPKKNNSHCIR